MMEDSYADNYRKHAKNRLWEYNDEELERKYWRLIELFESVLETDFNSQVYYFSNADLKEVIRFKSATSLADLAILVLEGEKKKALVRKEEFDDPSF